MNFEGKQNVSLEDLLRLKRVERPPAEFWDQFDRQLRAKQLKALVEKRPWWQRLPRAVAALGRFGRYRIPLGITAVLAVGFVSFREASSPRSAKPNQVEQINDTVVASVTVAPHPRVDENPSLSAVGAEERVAPAVATVAHNEPELTATAPMLASDATVPGEISKMVALLGTPHVEGSASPTPSARQIAANLATVQTETSVGRGLFASTMSFDRTTNARPPVEPLQQLIPPTERRRSQQLLTAMVSMASYESAPRTSERVSSGIAEQQLYERAHRFGAQGDRFHVKF